MSTRWPVHPASTPGEALSSWLTRIAKCYRATVEALAFDIGYSLDRDTDLDLEPPQGFVEQVAVRTGVSVDQIQKMSISGFVPWLLDHMAPGPDAFTPYARQLSVVLPEGRRADRTVAKWRAWVPATSKPQQRACPQCVAESTPPHPYQLMWSLPLMLSCPEHHCRLEPHEGPLWYYYSWYENPPEPQQVSAAIRAMDARTWQALTAGSVDLPRRRVHAGVWFRLLRTLIDELGSTVTECGAAQRLIRQVWTETGHPVRAGQLVWRPYEELPLEVQLHTLEAAATAIDLLENTTLAGRGRQAALFLPEPEVAIDSGHRRLKMADLAGSPMENSRPAAVEDLNTVIDQARKHRNIARRLFGFLTHYRRNDEAYLQQVRDNFAELGIPREFVSH